MRKHVNLLWNKFIYRSQQLSYAFNIVSYVLGIHQITLSCLIFVYDIIASIVELLKIRPMLVKKRYHVTFRFINKFP